jgi:hypothetical protein
MEGRVLLQEVQEEDLVVGLPGWLDGGECQALDHCELLLGRLQLGEAPHAAEGVADQDAGRLADLPLAIRTGDSAVRLVNELRNAAGT